MDPEKLRIKIQEILQTRLGVTDGSGLELLTTLHRVDVLSNTFDSQGQEAEFELSGPRWWLMLRLFLEEEMGNSNGLTPSSLSHAQRVSRNTISALLRGLENQGLIQRVMDSSDLRTFRIQLSPKGRELIMQIAPARIESLNSLYSVLSADERTTLMRILSKLTQTLMERHCKGRHRPHLTTES